MGEPFERTIEFHYNDDRVLAREQMRVQIEEFFTTVMG